MPLRPLLGAVMFALLMPGAASAAPVATGLIGGPRVVT
ncbi:MAG: hypothetical protein JWM31_1316, partial [Solirubrobacterales bacterium]|nr:hypothetical protein [Solirubrobacterales bacterium]